MKIVAIVIFSIIYLIITVLDIILIKHNKELDKKIAENKEKIKEQKVITYKLTEDIKKELQEIAQTKEMLEEIMKKIEEIEKFK